MEGEVRGRQTAVGDKMGTKSNFLNKKYYCLRPMDFKLFGQGNLMNCYYILSLSFILRAVTVITGLERLGPSCATARGSG